MKKISQESKIFKNAFENFSIESFLAVFEEEVVALKKKLHAKNIYINKSIMDMIRNYIKIIEEKLKLFLELLVLIIVLTYVILYSDYYFFFDTYSEKLNENVKLAVNNPVKIITKGKAVHKSLWKLASTSLKGLLSIINIKII